MKDTPEKIGKYPIKSKLGVGATSTVYLADDPFVGREVAIKVVYADALRDEEQGRRFKKLFLTEASLSGKLHHPHIAGIYDAVADADYHYLVMEYVPGGTLEKYCTVDNLLPFGEVVEIVFKCCRALDYASRAGVIHRDIKPANIMLGNQSDIKITDFGTALLPLSEHTQLSGLLGSPAYMSPEQVSEETLTHRTDIYSLGVVMYQMLTGRMPFTADNQFGLLYKIVHETPAAISDQRSNVPKILQDMVERAMQKSTAKRYQTWNEFSLDLTNAFAHIELPAGEISDTEKFDTLRKLNFFTDFTDVEIWELLRISSWKRIRANRKLIQEGKLGQSFYIIASGEAKVTKGKKLLSSLKAGDCLGEMAFIKQAQVPRVASVISDTDVVLVKIKAQSLLNASGNLQLRFNRKFLGILVDRLTETDELLLQL